MKIAYHLQVVTMLQDFVVSFSIHEINFYGKMCPIGEVPYLSVSNGDPIQCTGSMECPSGYYCSSHSGVCCGLAGTCSNPAESPLQDDIGRLIPCTPISFDSCPEGSECKDSVFATSAQSTGQHLCCRKNIFSCPISGAPVPSASEPQRCSVAKDTCPIGSICRPSNIQGTDICCSSLEISDENNVRYSDYNLCPTGWRTPKTDIEYCSPTKTTCSDYASCLLSPSTQQYVCCIPGQSQYTSMRKMVQVERTKKFTCYPPHNNVEQLNGLPRQCKNSPETECSIGYWCQMSREDIAVKICCGPFKSYDIPIPYYQSTLPLQCSLTGQTPVANPTNPATNLQCQSTGLGCNTGQTCQLALGQTNIFICCTSSTSTTNPLCPTGSSAQSSPTGFVPCTLNVANQCLTGFVCTQSVNLPGTALCCTSGTAVGQILICPNGQTLLSNNGQAQFCTPNQATNTCGSGYTCSESVASPGIFICCTLPNFPICPTGFSNALDTNGQTIFCTISNPNVCPAGTNCLQSSNQPQSYVCCRNTEAPRVCPNNQYASILSTGQLETCTGPGSVCSLASYTCQFSSVLSQFVCCGAQPSVATCADGRSTYTQVAGQTFQCPLNTCPSGYVCAPSNVNGINVCCQTLPTITTTFQPPSQALDCPIGWSAFEDASGAMRYCQNATDMSCPQGFSCAQSSLSGLFLCCRYASPITCSSQFTTLLVNNNPRLCSRGNSNSCPSGYTCQQSNIGQVYICCGNAPGTLTCDNGQIPAYIGSNVRYCSRRGYRDVCPPGYFCRPSNKDGLNVCCNSMARSPPMELYEQSDVCGPNALTYLDESGVPVACSADPTICPNNFHCQPSMTNIKMYCCQEAKCPGTSILPETPQTCKRDGECPRGLKCIRSANIPELKLCCHSYGYNLHEADPVPDIIRFARCKGRKTFLMGSHAITCSDNTGCPIGHECSSFTTSGVSICCESLDSYKSVCGENREPYRQPENDAFLQCALGSKQICPDGYPCKTVQSSDLPICCSPIAFCPPNHRPLIELSTKQAKRCFTPGSTPECGLGYACQESTVKDLYVCCESSPKDETLLKNNNDRPVINVEDNWTVMEG
uniref:Uncharacterized protein n=2 Tax=Acrobeloides nanus TaxID=290746 RepID=A0A914D9B2_9BILA